MKQQNEMDAFNKMQKKFDSLMSIVSLEEEKFREIEKRHMYNTRAMIPQPNTDPIDYRAALDPVGTYSIAYERD